MERKQWADQGFLPPHCRAQFSRGNSRNFEVWDHNQRSTTIRECEGHSSFSRRLWSIEDTLFLFRPFSSSFPSSMFLYSPDPASSSSKIHLPHGFPQICLSTSNASRPEQVSPGLIERRGSNVIKLSRKLDALCCSWLLPDSVKLSPFVLIKYIFSGLSDTELFFCNI